MSESPAKRRRVDNEGDQEMYKLDEEDDSYVPYVPVKQQRQQKLQLFASRGPKAKLLAEATKEKERGGTSDSYASAPDDEEREEEKRREKARLERTLLLEAQQVKANKALEGVFSTFIV
jgi:ATP-dependent RNA helicase DDX41